MGLSVIMPTFNGERYITDALDSLSGQGADEVIVVDDGSNDSTLVIAASYQDRLPLRIVQPEPRQSWPAMTNIGLEAARNRWAAILHQDDVWLPGRRALINSYLNTDSLLIATCTRYIDDFGRTVGPWRIPRSVRSNPERFSAALYVQNWLSVPSVTFRTDVALGAGGLDETLWYTADWDLWLKLAKRGLPACVPGYGAAFRVHSASQTVKGSRNVQAFRRQLITVQDRHSWAADASARPRRIRAAGSLSSESNVMLACALHGSPSLGPWLSALRQAGPVGAIAYVRNSAIADRLGARLRSRLPATGRRAVSSG